MRPVLAVSPHLDDVAFSCGGVVARLAAAGRRVVLATVFTQSVDGPTGFALACQTDKGLPVDVDYMALRRDEDRAAGAALGVAAVVHLPHAEAPHRGYGSAAALFTGRRGDDGVVAAVAADLAALVAAERPEVVLGPQGLGGHVDHGVVLDALAGLGAPVVRYRDTPYALRGGAPAVGEGVPLDAVALGRKLDACACYASQLGFQFGGEVPMRAALARFAAAEGAATGLGAPAERLAGPVPPSWAGQVWASTPSSSSRITRSSGSVP